MSSTQLKTAIADGKPIVGIVSSTTCIISSLVHPHSSALRVCEWTAPSSLAPAAIQSLIKDLVFSSSGPELWTVFPSCS